MTLQSNMHIRRIPDQVGSEVSGETVVLSLRNDLYYGLDDVGTVIWRFIAEARTVEQICRHVTEQYEVSEDECILAVERFVSELNRNGLVELLPISG